MIFLLVYDLYYISEPSILCPIIWSAIPYNIMRLYASLICPVDWLPPADGLPDHPTPFGRESRFFPRFRVRHEVDVFKYKWSGGYVAKTNNYVFVCPRYAAFGSKYDATSPQGFPSGVFFLFPCAKIRKHTIKSHTTIWIYIYILSFISIHTLSCASELCVPFRLSVAPSCRCLVEAMESSVAYINRWHLGLLRLSIMCDTMSQPLPWIRWICSWLWLWGPIPERIWVNLEHLGLQHAHHDDDSLECNGKNRGGGLLPPSPVASINLQSMGIELTCPCLALEGQIIKVSHCFRNGSP